jgi:hypothetical protein
MAKDHDIPVDPDAPAFDIDAMAIWVTRRKRGRWKPDLHIGEEAYCFLCNKPTMTLTPKGDGGVMARCDNKSCMARGWPMFRAAEDDGYNLSAPRSVTRKLAKLEQAEREVEDAWNGLSKRGKAVAVSLGVLLNHDASRNLPVELTALVAATGLSKSSVQRGIDDAGAAGLIKRGRKTFSQGVGKGPINRYALANETVAHVIRKNTVQLTIGPDLLGSKLTTGGTENRRNAGVGESTRSSERDMPYESAPPVVDSPTPVGAVDACRRERMSLAMRISETDSRAGAKLAATSGRPAHTQLTTIRPGVHYGSAPPTSDGSVLPLEAEIAERCIPARGTARTIRTREAGSMPAHTHTRETAIHGSDPMPVFDALRRERALKPTPPRWTLAAIDSLGDTASAHSDQGAKPATRMPESTLAQQMIENEEKRRRRAGTTSDSERNRNGRGH